MIENAFRVALRGGAMFRKGDRVLVAVSGGSDSTALLALFARARRDLGVDLHVAHLDHGWRGEASARDAEFVRRLARRFRVPVTFGHVDPATWRRAGLRMAGRRQSSREARARTLRRRFLKATAAKVGAQRIALGHTLDDQAESFLMRLLRGSGRRGLGGIHPVVDGLFIRPLLGLRRSELRAWLRARGLRWREDATNRDLSLTRNRVRRRLLPLLERQFNPKAAEVLARTADILRDEEAWLEPMTTAAYEAAVSERSKGVAIDREQLRAMPLALRRRVVRLAIARMRGHLRGVDKWHVDWVLHVMSSRCGNEQAVLPEGLWVERDGPDLVFEVRQPAAEVQEVLREGSLPAPGDFELGAFRLTARLASPGEGLPKPGARVALLDADLVKEPLLVRSRRPGDRFHPQGAPGSRRLKSFLIDRKVPVDERGRIPLVLTGERIAWVVGHRIDDRFKITPATRQVLVLTKETR